MEREARVFVADPGTLRAEATALAALLVEAVDAGAGMGFAPPLSLAEAGAFWRSVAEDVARKARIVVLATDGETLVGTAQLELSLRTNGLHRAEVQKVMVASRFQRRGWGLRILRGIDEAALRAGRTTLVLDTFKDQGARRLYEAAGWTHAGDIPEYARTADGRLGTTSYYYRILRKA